MLWDNPLKIRRALFTVSDKTEIVELAKVLAKAGAEIVATGKTAVVLREAGVRVRPIEEVSKSPEAFQGRMKTLSFPVCSGILFRRGDLQDEADLKKLNIEPIDCVVVNFYPFEKVLQEKPNLPLSELIEEIDIGGPTLVRAAAKNSAHVLVLTDPHQYKKVISELNSHKEVSGDTLKACAEQAWDRITEYDRAISEKLGAALQLNLRYGENPHQTGYLKVDAQSPIDWTPLTQNELSYNNILDLSAAYGLMSDLKELAPESSSVVIVKHGNPCGVACISKDKPDCQKEALIRAWQGDPTSAFGGVLVFSEPLREETCAWLSERFVELVAAPELTPLDLGLKKILTKRKKLKAVLIRRFGEMPKHTQVHVPGGILHQSADLDLGEKIKSVTEREFSPREIRVARFGIAVARALKSNAIALVREIPALSGSLQLVGAGQGQPNRIEALQALAVPRARQLFREENSPENNDETQVMKSLIMVSDAFFPFRDTVDFAHSSGIEWIVQPGGSLKDQDSIDACNGHGMAMAFSGVRHFKH